MEAAATSKKRTAAEQTEAVSHSHWYSLGAAGILRYRREPTTSLAAVPPGRAPAEPPADCEYCGREARPPLEPPRGPEEAAAFFCCSRRQQLYELLEEDRCASGRADVPARAAEARADEAHDPHQLDADWPCALKKRPKEGVSVPRPPAAEDPSYSLSFRLSRAPERCWKVHPSSVAEQHFRGKEEQSERRTLKFGVCDHRGGSDFSQRSYSSGSRLLTAFSDGAAQLFYPSGSLAIVVMVTEERGRLCMVYDDGSDSPRAVFHSDGRAVCYHRNKSLWLDLNRSAGRCVEGDGRGTRQWTWSGRGRAPTALEPLQLALNERVKVRVLGREQVFVSLQACGEEVELSVGGCSF